jgi:phosphoribosylaminoimidazole-succinocarboxamide synthase
MMGAKIPEKVLTPPLKGVKLVFRGKVRDTYEIPNHPNILLVVASDRISIFDFVLPTLVPKKGEVLTALTVFWLKEILHHFPHHLIAYGAEIDEFLPYKLRKNPELQKRAIIVKKLNMIPIECIVRGYLTGSIVPIYNRIKERKIYGNYLPPGLHDGSKLPYPIFTPTTKEEIGHDKMLYPDEVVKRWPELERMSLQIYQVVSNYAIRRKVIIADTKFEFGYDEDGIITLGDEVVTPDSSRFWNMKDWEIGLKEKKSSIGWDKQIVREWGKTKMIDKMDPTKPEHLKYVNELEIPPQLIEETSKRYLEIFFCLTRQQLEKFQSRYGIKV